MLKRMQEKQQELEEQAKKEREQQEEKPLEEAPKAEEPGEDGWVDISTASPTTPLSGEDDTQPQKGYFSWFTRWSA